MTGRAPLLASVFVAVLAALPAGKAAAASLLEKNFYLSVPQYEGKLPPCDYRDALTMIASRFNQKENMYWATDLRIVNFERIREFDDQVKDLEKKMWLKAKKTKEEAEKMDIV